MSTAGGKNEGSKGFVQGPNLRTVPNRTIGKQKPAKAQHPSQQQKQSKSQTETATDLDKILSLESDASESQIQRASAMPKASPHNYASKGSSKGPDSSSASGAVRSAIASAPVSLSPGTSSNGGLAASCSLPTGAAPPAASSPADGSSPVRSPFKKAPRRDSKQDKQCGCTGSAACIECDPQLFAYIKMFSNGSDAATSRPHNAAASSSETIKIDDDSQTQPGLPNLSDTAFWAPGGGSQNMPATQFYDETPVPEPAPRAGSDFDDMPELEEDPLLLPPEYTQIGGVLPSTNLLDLDGSRDQLPPNAPHHDALEQAQLLAVSAASAAEAAARNERDRAENQTTDPPSSLPLSPTQPIVYQTDHSNARGSGSFGGANSPGPPRVDHRGNHLQQPQQHSSVAARPALASADRQRSESPELRHDNQQPSGFDFEKMLGKVKEDLVMQANSSVNSIMVEYDKYNSKRHNKNEHDIKELQREGDRRDVQYNDMEKRLQAVEKRFDIQDTSESFTDYQRTVSWDGKPDETLLRISTNALSTRASILQSLDSFLGPLDYKFEKDYALRGGIQPASYTWTVYFTGAYMSAARRCKKALTSLRSPTGKWQNFDALQPDGSTTPMYINADKNGKQKSTEVLGKKLYKAAKETHPTVNFYHIKKDGVLSVGRKRLVWVYPAADLTFQLWWDNDLVAELDIDKDKIKSQVEAMAAAANYETQWQL